ncbi:MAG: hypothetical protein WC791_03365 [Candidatus Paceibacterota bacterium]|jgi:hypothetical protein
MQSKVDRMNGKTGSSPANKDGGGEKAKTTTPPEKGWWAKKDLNAKAWFLYTSNAIVSILITSVVAYVFDGVYAEWRFFAGGAFFWLVCHLVIWTFYTDKTSNSTKAFVVATAIFFFFAVVIPDATVRAVERVDEMRKGYDNNLFLETTTTAGGSKVSSPKKGIVCFGDGNCWMRFDQTGDSWRYNVTPGNEGIEILVTSPTDLPVIPAGYVARIHCEGGETLSWWTGIPYPGGYIQNCARGGQNKWIGKGIVGSREPLPNLKIQVRPATAKPIHVLVELKHV